MAFRRHDAAGSSSRTHGDSDSANDGSLTFTEFLGLRGTEWPESGTFERRQRRRTDLDALSPPRYRRSENGAANNASSSTTAMQSAYNQQSSNRPAQPSTSAMPTNTIRERGSLEPLPKWQADHEVDECPVCKSKFSFFFRKHHCRKCGRVVCSNCSPHRITIPRQYVVQPPVGDDSEVSEAYPARNLGGGEVVRVCNPCVPDPWTPETARDAPEPPRSRQQSTSSATGSDTVRLPQRYRIHVGTHQPLPPPSGRMRAQSHQPTSSLSTSIPGERHALNRSRPAPVFSTPSAASSSRPRHRHTQSSANAPPPYQTYDPRVRPLSAAVAAGSSTPPYRQRREVKEEDECPVCGEELPPGDDIRAAHVEECISTRFGTPSQASNLPNTIDPSTRTSSTPPAISVGSRPRASTYRPRGMAVYKATEKDCQTAEGEAQECVICFEEFQPGDEMGRMECLCKFHRACIRQWWETKGAGSCPTHQVQQED